ncbi:phage virion morphogenesis protein [Terasakiella sp. A23]|uniref:phage virion morphogenesis protein n=1 Tax=Terasakiella sp. FCG-A23 TaxID=3080561 RepID=UPI002953956E|nr:phage virion morphogenesis protein [Terasakiella sp. A23]MDV7340975.1 phage virion morphogenesis protein [Terasakiella sp. A23]
MSASIEVDFSKLGRMGAQVQRFLSNVSETDLLLEAIGMGFTTETNTRFREGKGPEGVPWEKTNRGGQILVDSGITRDSFNSQVEGSTVKHGSNQQHVKTHQFGAVIKPKNAKVLAFEIDGKMVFARKVTIPARPILGIDDGTTKMIRGEIADFVRAARTGAFA